MQFVKSHLTLAELGRVFGVTKCMIAKWLENVGLRTNRGKPSFTAFSGKYVSSLHPPTSDNKHVWHGIRTVAALVENGHKPVVPPPTDLVTTPHLDGPFTIRVNPDAPHEIVGATGEVAVWVAGDLNAHHVCRLLNVGYRLGVLPLHETELHEKSDAEPVLTETDGFVIVGF